MCRPALITRQTFLRAALGLAASPLLCYVPAHAAAADVSEVAPGVFVHQGRYEVQNADNRGDIANASFVVGDEAVAVIDTSGSAVMGQELRDAIRAATDKPIRYVINTHMHPDHTGGNARLESVDAAIIATENARTRLAESQSAGLPLLTFEDHLRLYFAGRPMDLYWLGRGHTDGDLIIHLPEDGLVLTGDLFAGGDPYVRLIDYNGGGSLKEWPGTVERILELDFDTVIPGHSAVTDRAMLRDYLDDTSRLWAFVGELHRAGRSAEDIQAAVASEFGRSGFVVLPDVESVLAELE